MSTIRDLAREYNAQPYEIAAFLDLGRDYSDDTEVEPWMREALDVDNNN